MYKFIIQDSLPSVLWRCWLGGRKGIWPVKSEWWGAGMVVCLEQGADLHMAQLMSWPLTVSCFIKIQTGFTFPVPTYPGSCKKRAIKRVCVCMCDSMLPPQFSVTKWYTNHKERWMCGTKLKDRFPSSELRERLGIDDISLVLQQNRLRWYGHLLRKEDNDWLKKYMEYEVEGPRPRGRPKRT